MERDTNAEGSMHAGGGGQHMSVGGGGGTGHVRSRGTPRVFCGAHAHTLGNRYMHALGAAGGGARTCSGGSALRGTQDLFIYFT